MLNLQFLFFTLVTILSVTLTVILLWINEEFKKRHPFILFVIVLALCLSLTGFVVTSADLISESPRPIISINR